MLCYYCTPKTQHLCTACGGIGVLYCCEGMVGGPHECGSYQGGEREDGDGPKKKVDKRRREAHATFTTLAVS